MWSTAPAAAAARQLHRPLPTKGLGVHYRNRTAAPPSVRGMDLVPDELAVYDLPEVQRGFVRHGADASEVRAAATAERLNGDAQGGRRRVLPQHPCSPAIWLACARVTPFPPTGWWLSIIQLPMRPCSPVRRDRW